MFLKEECYESAISYAACIEFHRDEQHRRGFNVSQLIDYSLDPNPDAADDKSEPPQKLSLVFSTADVVLLGWRLDRLGNLIRENKLVAVGILPRRYAELDRAKVFVSAITITQVGKGEK